MSVVPVAEKPFVLTVTQSADEMKQQLAVLQHVCKTYLTDKVDYGLIPGTGKKPALFKPGAEKLMDVFGLSVDVVIEAKVENWENGLFDYIIKAYIKTRDGRLTLSSAMGSCSSFESKYRYVTKKSKMFCPACEAEGTILKSKFPDRKTGDIGWWCKNEVCKANFVSDDPGIVSQIEELKSQTGGKEQREDMADIKNTILKMAEKRAVVAAVIRATRAADIFTQDMEDLSDSLPTEYLDVEWKDVTSESKAEEPKKEEGKPQPKSTGNKGPASAKGAEGSSQQSQAPAPGAGAQTTPKSPAQSASKNQESQASEGNAQSASGGLGVSDAEFVTLKSGIWRAFCTSKYAVEVAEGDEVAKKRNTAEFKKILKEKFNIDSDNAQDLRAKLDSSKAGEIAFFFNAKK